MAVHGAILASKVLISDTTNVFPDFDMEDADFYASSTAAAFFFTTTPSQVLGRRFLSIPVSGAFHSVESGWFAVEPSTEYLVSASAWLSTATAGSGTSTVSVETGTLAANGVVTVSTSTTVATRTDATTTPPLSVSVITGPTIRRMRFVLSRSAGGTANGRGAGYKVQKKATGLLVVDGTITGTLLAAAGIITGTAQISDAIITGAKIGNLQVDTLQIANRAVTVPEFAIITSSAAVTITSTSIWKNVLSVTINRTGIDTRIAFNGQFDAVSGSTDVQLRVRRNGTAFGSTFDIGLSTRQSISFTTLDTDTGTGATTYDVDVILITAGNARMYQRFVEAIQFKK